MMIKLTRSEVEEACGYWLRAHGKSGTTGHNRETSEKMPVAVDHRMKITCNFTRSGVECYVEEKP